MNFLFRIPTELIDTIFEYFEEGKAPAGYMTHPTAASCNLVCRALHAHAQKHLFKAIRCTFGTDDDEVYEGRTPEDKLIGAKTKHERETEARRGRLVEFADFLERHPAIATTIRTLQLRVKCPPHTGCGYHEVPHTCLSEPIIRVLKLLPKLRELTLMNVDLSDYSEEVAPFVRKLDFLCLARDEDPFVATYESTFGPLHWFEKVKRVEIGGCWDLSFSRRSAPPQGSFEELVLAPLTDVGYHAQIVPIIAGHCLTAFKSMRLLDVGRIDLDDIISLEEVLEANRNTLEYLALDLYYTGQCLV